MRHLQTIKAGTFLDCAAWIVTDASNRLAQARRIDGQKFQFSNGKEKKLIPLREASQAGRWVHDCPTNCTKLSTAYCWLKDRETLLPPITLL
jgi:hypothetical protein